LEVLQIVDCIQDFASVYSLNFKFSRNQVVYEIRIGEKECHYAIFIDDGFMAQIELMEEGWKDTSGDMDDRDLREEVIRHINASSG
jgi:hypothetical protein